jgi:hypothetical protein
LECRRAKGLAIRISSFEVFGETTWQTPQENGIPEAVGKQRE